LLDIDYNCSSIWIFMGIFLGKLVYMAIFG
jgi:hypothetical protein